MEDKIGTTRLLRTGEENSVDDLLVFGYASSIFPNDEKAQYIAEERHLQSCNGDESLRIDRYDCRLLLSTIDLALNGDHHTASCPTEDLEEEMCEEERYKDMYRDINSCVLQEESSKLKKAEIGFNYDSSVPLKADDSESDSEGEPFEPPQGVKLPVGLIVPENQKQNHIIERTALFVVSKGPQMEIVIKAKQRNNMEQFGFLEFDNNLHPYYKYISKLIREKKYIPDLTKRLTRKTAILKQSSEKTVENEKKHSNALAAIAEEHGSDSDDSDSDYELHPSLIARNREKSPDIMDETDNAAGPRQRPLTPPEKVVSAIRTDYDMSKSNDMYASLFKNLTKVSNTKEERRKREQEQKLLHKHVVASAPPPPDEEFRKWWLSFYGTTCPFSHPPPMLPPPPDLEPVVTSYAEFVAQHGAEVEASLLNRPDLQLHFMHISSPHFSYYQHKVRCAQWNLAQQKQVTPSYSDAAPPSGSSEFDDQQIAITEVPDPSALSSVSSSPVPAADAPLNRKQRRRLQDAFRVSPALPPGIIDPVGVVIAVSNEIDSAELTKAHSSPALLTNLPEPPVVPPPTPPSDLKPYMPLVPVSFTLAPVKDESKAHSPTSVADSSPCDNAEPSSFSPVPVPALPSPLPPLIPPIPPAIPNNSQLDRKEKARIFMEKLLNEKRIKRAREVEDARIRELELKKAEIERQLAEAEAARHSEEIENPSKRKCDKEKPVKTLDMIDQLINSRINNLLQSTGLPVDERRSEQHSGTESDEEKAKKKRKKEKKKRSKHKDGRLRSSSRSPVYSDRNRRKRREGGFDSDRESRKRRKERR